MDELEFAIDGLYASGWWPSDEDCCLQARDGRWFPSESMIQAEFTKEFVNLTISNSAESASVVASWKSLSRAPRSVRGRSRQETLVLAYTLLTTERLVATSR